MNSDGLRTFLASLKDTDIEELRLESGKTKVSFKRSSVTAIDGMSGLGTMRKPLKTGLEVKEKSYSPIKSPMVGTFYHSDSADRPPFVMEGNHISPGQKIGIIETMKIMKDVNSTLKGKIVKVLIKNGRPVEYGQELFLVDTEDKK